MKRTFLLTSLLMMGFTGAVVASFEPTLSRVYSTPFTSQVQQYNSAGTQGSLDASFGTAGSLSINTQLSGGQAQAIQVLSDGTFLVVLTKLGSDSIIAKYNAQGSLVSAYGTSGVADLGSSTTAAQALMIDSQGRALVAGGANAGTGGWLKRVSTDGSTVTSFTTGTAWEFIAGLAQQTSGKIIAAGFNGTHAQIARYTLAGALDTTFGTSGLLVFDGVSGRPSSTNGLYNVVVDGDDNIYVLYLDSTTAKVAKFGSDGTPAAGFGLSGISTVAYLASATVQTMRMGIDLAGQLVLGATVSSNVNVTSMTLTGITPGDLANFTTAVFDGLYSIVPTNDGKVLLAGSKASSEQMAVMRLTSAGDLDNSTAGNNTPFNTTGYNLFNISSPTVSSILTAASVAPDGQLYAVGYQATGGTPTVTPYVSRLFNAPYVSAIASFPAAQEQGILDTTFGINATQSFRGVTMPYNGNFGASLQQQPRSIVELAAGDFLIGSDGLTNSSGTATTNMMLTWLTSAGALDTTIGASSSGKLTLTAAGANNETMAGLAVGGSGTVYVAGTVTGATNPAVIRSYTSTSTTAWTVGTAANSTNDVGLAGATTAVGVAIQGSAGILLFVQDPTATQGHISRYYASTLALDGTFGASGYIQTTALGLNMGPVYGGGLVNRAENIIVAYQYNGGGTINVALINKSGSALVSAFGTAGVATDVFGGVAVDPTSVRIAFDTNDHENIYVAAALADGTQYVVTKLDGITGAVDTSFNNGTILEIIPGTSPSALTLTNLTGVSDGTLMLQGAGTFSSQPYMLTMRVTSTNTVHGTASLDTTFNSQGATPGVAAIQIENEAATYNARTITGLAIQSNSSPHGNLIYSAYENQTSSQSTPEAFRLFGQSGTTQTQRFPTQDQYPGTLDIALNDCGAMDIASLTHAGQAKVVYAYPDGNVYEGQILIGVDSGSALYITRVNQTTLLADTTFGTDGLYTITGVTGLENIAVDGDNNILLCGTQSSFGWVYRVSQDANITAIAFDMPSDITGAHMVYQQKSGRYIVAGNTNSVGTLVAFQDVVVGSATTLAVDETFNPLSTSSSVAGRWNIAGSTALYNLVINSDDTIYTAYKDTSSNLLTIAQVLANGAGLNTAFNTTGKLATSIIPDRTSGVRCVVDSSQNVIVAAGCGSGTSLQAFRCNLTGGTSTAFTTGGIVSNNIATISTASLTTGLALDALLEDTNGKTILVGSNTSSIHGTMFAVRLASTGNLDTTWNPSATSPDVAGILTFGGNGNPLTPAITLMSNATINESGNIFAVGGNGTDPILMEIVGDSAVLGVPQGQTQAAAGTYDQTLPTNGNLNLVTASLLQSTYTPKKFYTYSDGSMLIGSSNGTSTNLVKLTAARTIDTRFNHGAILNLGAATQTLNDMFVANAQGEDETIYVAGTTSSAPWAMMISADGLTRTPVVTSALSSWTMATAIRLAANGNILVAGFNGTDGAVASFFPNGSALDTSFATDGLYATGSTYQIADMAVDNLGRIYIAYLVSGGTTTININRLTSVGSLDDSFGTNGVVTITGTAWSATQIKLQLDVNNNQVVLAAQDTISSNGLIPVFRFSTVDGSATGAAVVSVSSRSLSLSDLFIDSDQEIYVAATNTTDSQAVVARLTSTSSTAISLNSDYGTDGIANVPVGAITSIGAASLNPDGRVYMVGFTSPNSYMARLFGDNYDTQVSQAYASSTLGEFDYSYGTNGVATNFANGATDATANQYAITILPLTTGSKLLTVVGNGTNSWTVQLLSNGANDSTYGSGEGIIITKATTGSEIVVGMVFDGANNRIVFGSNSSAGGYVKNILPSGSMNTQFGGVGTDPAGTVYLSQLSQVNAVAQLSSGNYVYVGTGNNIGLIGMLNGVGQPITSFNASRFGTNISSVSIDADDNIYIVYATAGVNANVAKLDATGNVVTAYGNNGIVSSVIGNINSSGDMRSVFDVDGKVMVAATSNSNPASVSVRRLNLDGSIDTTFNGGVVLSIPFAADTISFVTSLVALQNGNYYLAGFQYDASQAAHNYEFVAAVTNAGELDTNFNIDGTVPGILTFQVASAEQLVRVILGMSVQDNGEILLAGGEIPVTNEALPLTMRVNGYTNIKSIPQFTGAVPVVPSDISSKFGIVYTFPGLGNLVNGGSTTVDSQNRVLVGGITSDQTFLVARFLANGILDEDFSNGSYAGISQSPVIPTLTSGSFITVDSNDNVYVSGITSDQRFIIAKFLGTNGQLDTAGYNAGAAYGVPAGITQSVAVTNLMSGGSIAIDATPGRCVVGGITSDHKLAAGRFTVAGLQDATFSSDGVATTGVIPTLYDGGYVATSVLTTDANAVYVGGSTYASTLLMAKFTNSGVLDGSYGTGGIAQTGMITNLVQGGLVALNSGSQGIVAGYTSDKTFVVAKFTTAGIADTNFSSDGIAFSNPLSSLDACNGIAVDNNDRIIVGGLSTAYDSISKSMVAARWFTGGLIDITFGNQGLVTTGTVADLVSGGFTAVNVLDNVFLCGYAGTRLVIAGTNSGAEIFISNPNGLPQGAAAIFKYGNNLVKFAELLNVSFFAEKFITDSTVRGAVIAAVLGELNSYVDAYQDQPNLNLSASTSPGWDGHFALLRAVLVAANTSSADDINNFFNAWNIRRVKLHQALFQYSNQ